MTTIQTHRHIIILGQRRGEAVRKLCIPTGSGMAQDGAGSGMAQDGAGSGMAQDGAGSGRTTALWAQGWSGVDGIMGSRRRMVSQAQEWHGLQGSLDNGAGSEEVDDSMGFREVSTTARASRMWTTT
jgi:hypothetical protein